MAILGFVLTITILVGFHEFGHMIIARAAGVRVLEWCIGFGPRLFSFQKTADSTRYSVAALPLGGFVRMLERSSLKDTEQTALQKYCFESQSISWRALIVAAGPAANLILAFLIFMLLTFMPQYDLSTGIAKVRPGSIGQQLGFKAGDTILSIDQRPLTGWNQQNLYLYSHALGEDSVDIEVRSQQDELKTVRVDFSEIAVSLRQSAVLSSVLGLIPDAPAIQPIVGEVFDARPAQKAGMLPDDRIQSIDFALVNSWQDFVTALRASTGPEIRIVVERQGNLTELLIQPEKLPQSDYPSIGIRLKEQPYENYLLPVEAQGLWQSIKDSVQKVVQISALHGHLILHLVQGSEAASENIGGPIAIAQAAGRSLDTGIRSFLEMLAVLSISLGLLNLLPLPVLDGGHLALLGLEKVRGRPLSQATQSRINMVGVAIILTLMAWTIAHDLNLI